MDIKVLGPGCKNCVTLEQRTKEALANLGAEATVEKIEDYDKIASYGIMATPGLARLLSWGKCSLFQQSKSY